MPLSQWYFVSYGHPKTKRDSNPNAFGKDSIAGKASPSQPITKNKVEQGRKGSSTQVMSSQSSSSIDEPYNIRKANEKRPVASSASAASAFGAQPRQPQSHILKKSSTALPTNENASETSAGTGISFLRNNFPFFRNSTSRSRSQSVVSDASRSSEAGRDSKKDKDKSYRRKSHLNRAFTDEAVPDHDNCIDNAPKSSKPTSHEASSLESSAVEESRYGHPKPNVKIHPAIPSVLTSANNKSGNGLSNSINRNSQNFGSMPSSPLTISKNSSMGKIQSEEQQSRKGSPVVKKDSFSDAEGVSFIKKMLQKESDRDRAAAAVTGSRQASQGTSTNGNSGYSIKKCPSAGNQSYWSKFSSSQSAFLRKLFDKPKPTENLTTLIRPLEKESLSSGNSDTAPVNTNLNGNPTTDKNGCGNDNVGMEKENGEPVMGFSVAQKASFFMKLEHEQRFSKWRKNSVDLGVISSATRIADHLNSHENGNISVVTNNPTEFRCRTSRHFTQPVTPTELRDIPLLKAGSSMNFERNNPVEFGSQPKIYWANNNVNSSFTAAAENVSDTVENSQEPSSAPKSFYNEYDDLHKFEPIAVAQESKKENNFDEIATGKLEPIQRIMDAPSAPALKSYSLTRSGRTVGSNHVHGNLEGFPMYHSASAIINTGVVSSAGNSNVQQQFQKGPSAAHSSSSSSFSEAMSRQEDNMRFFPMSKAHKTSGVKKSKNTPLAYVNGDCRRRGSASDLELSGAANLSPLFPRAEKVASVFIPKGGYHCDVENLSEDGEFSSGGQEVAEIICRSYENSPVFRKKNWRTQKHNQTNFTKEIWRRCGNYENWSQRSSSNNVHPQQQQMIQSRQHPVPQTFTTTTNVSTAPLPTVAASPPPTTSNLLQILTVLSSSNDELSDSKSKGRKQYRQHFGGEETNFKKPLSSGKNSIPPIHPGHNRDKRLSTSEQRCRSANTIANSTYKNNSNSPGPAINCAMPQSPLPGKNEIFVSVPHPEDEAFQSFFCSVKSYTQVTHYPSAENPCLNDNNEHSQKCLTNNDSGMSNGVHNGLVEMDGCDGPAVHPSSEEALDISSVRRESDLLVMKKNVPPAKRKSTNNGKYKNPLRALAARMDFRQQGYTQQNHTNSVHYCSSSDVDVTT